jgi:hypothetical protein
MKTLFHKINRWIQDNPEKGERYLLYFIFFVAFIFRALQFDLYLSNEELELLSKVQVSPFQEYLAKVGLTNGSPIGHDLLLKGIISVFGENSPWLRVPYFILGMAVIPLLYSVAVAWFSRRTALWVTILFAVLSYPLNEAKYVSSPNWCLLFLLIFAQLDAILYPNKGVNSIPNNLIQHKSRSFIIAGYLLSGFLASAFSYGAMSFVVFWLTYRSIDAENSQRRFSFWMFSWLNLMLLPIYYLLYLQLNNAAMTGLKVVVYESWLNYLFVVFNESHLVILMATFIVVIYGFLYGLHMYRFQMVMLAGIVFCLFFNLFLQNKFLNSPFLYFAYPLMPFLLMVLASLLEKQRIQGYITEKRLRRIPIHALTIYIGLFLVVVLSMSLIFEKKHFSNRSAESIQPMVSVIQKVLNNYGSDKVVGIAAVKYPLQLTYYLNNSSQQSSGFEFEMRKFRRGTIYFTRLQELLKQNQKSYFMLAWAGEEFLEEIPELIRQTYPFIEVIYKSEQSGVILFSRHQTAKSLKTPTILAQLRYQPPAQDTSASYFSRSVAFGNIRQTQNPLEFTLTKKMPYATEMIVPAYQLPYEDTLLVRCTANVMLQDTNAMGLLTIYVRDKYQSEPVKWSGMNVSNYCPKPNIWYKAYHAMRVPSTILSPNAEVVVSAWSPDGRPVHIENYQFEIIRAPSFLQPTIPLVE